MENAGDALVLNRTAIKTKSKIREYIEAILWALLLALIIRVSLLQPFRIPSGSMKATLLVGDYLLVNKFIYGIRVPFTDLRLPAIRDPERGDVIVFKYPEDRSKDYIKRVIGLPGDEIQIKDKQVYINGTVYKNPHEIHVDPNILPEESSQRDNFGPVRVPSDSYFVMGDNRDSSYDSRYWGFVSKTDLVGMAIIKWWSWDHGAWRVRWDRVGRVIE
ncbi:MAG: signal peptidase I [Deltaproteobacteria bacterium]|nr:signal peptidase I [Deltaproteobacteria bacterium]